MPHQKTAISVPAELLEAVDEAARARGESRSAFISRVLRIAVRARRGTEITRRLDALFADEAQAKEQIRDAEAWEKVAQPWDDEGW